MLFRHIYILFIYYLDIFLTTLSIGLGETIPHSYPSREGPHKEALRASVKFTCVFFSFAARRIVTSRLSAAMHPTSKPGMCAALSSKDHGRDPWLKKYGRRSTPDRSTTTVSTHPFTGRQELWVGSGLGF